ncbi:hypothetical protein [Micromonospora inositola]|uniref:hypothetical protein n=1 Tax=Micromonospora inositola TaxID=47865 RepID=UPI000B5ACF87|nr:hypothetical protein [Micromonospora inositola]
MFLAGAQLGQGNLWASIADQLGLPAVGADVLLLAMDAAGEAATTAGSRFLIVLDALNETVPADFWRVHLPALRSAVAQYPHVALVVSCRDTYRDLVLDGAESSHFLQRTHPGFADRRLDVPGIFALIYGVIEGGQQGWTSPQALVALPLAALVLTGFVLVERRSPSLGRRCNAHGTRPSCRLRH